MPNKVDPKADAAFKTAEALAKKHGIKSTRRGLSRWLRLEAEKRKILTEKARLEKELADLDAKIS